MLPKCGTGRAFRYRVTHRKLVYVCRRIEPVHYRFSFADESLTIRSFGLNRMFERIHRKISISTPSIAGFSSAGVLPTELFVHGFISLREDE